VEELAIKLQKFYDDYESGKKPMLIIEAPPQHGKSETINDFISWMAGKDPSCKTIFASFSERLGIRSNLKLQRMYTRKVYKDIFPHTKINEKNVVTGTNYLRNREILEYTENTGYFRNTTVQGSITGESLDLGIIDDPIKGRESANSETTRNKTWEWFTDDFFTRFSENAGFLMILTRWHVDDPAARLIKEDSNVTVLKYKAIAEEDEENRLQGEALIPNHKSLEFLLKRKKIMGANFEALYQQNPVVRGGNIFRDSYWKWWVVEPVLTHKFITVDTAQKKNTWNDWTVAQCWGVDKDKNIYLLDMLRIKEEAPEMRRAVKAFYLKHNNNSIKDISLRAMHIEDKSSGSTLIQDFKRDGMKIKDIQRNTDKGSRALDRVPYVEAGKVHISENISDISELLSEARGFPNMPHDDCLDPLMDAIEIGCVQSVNSLLAAMTA